MGGWDEDSPQTPRQTLESVNIVKALQAAAGIVADAIAVTDSFQITLKSVCHIHQQAMTGVIETAGRFRTADVLIRGSKHVPPSTVEVVLLVDEMLRATSSVTGGPFARAAYTLWRLNWIHPFDDGNGRTARVLAMMIIFAGLRRPMVTRRDQPTFLDRLSWRKLEYNDALEAADAAFKRGTVDVSMLTQLLFEVVRDSLQ